MTRSPFREYVRTLLCFLVATVLVLPAATQADQAQYFYDELGQLVAVVDGQGNAAVYNYDEVGNLVSIQRFTTGSTGIGIFVVAPGSARASTNVTIRGFGFTTLPSSNQVAFNSTPATVVSATSTSIVATVPSGATTGPVTVTNANGTATSPQAFTVLVPPIISGVQPATVPKGATTQLTIEGFSLANASSVTFQQSGITTTILPGGTSQNLLVTITVAGTVPDNTYTFSVTTPVGTTQSGTVTVRVAPAQPSFGNARVSVFKPLPTNTPPSGSSMSVAPPSSVSMP